jgi:hypothetical protein
MLIHPCQTLLPVFKFSKNPYQTMTKFSPCTSAYLASEHIGDLIDSLVIIQFSPQWQPIWKAMGDVNLGDAIVALGIVKDKLEELEDGANDD